MIKRFYCAICWQEFDDPREHDAISGFQGQRLNGHCDGDIRLVEPSSQRKVKTVIQPEVLNLDSGVPLTIT